MKAIQKPTWIGSVTAPALLAALLLVKAGIADDREQSKLQDIIGAIRDNEQLYRDISLEYDEMLESMREDATTPWRITQEVSHSRLVLQKALVWYDEARTGKSVKGPYEKCFNSGYDGERLLEYQHNSNPGNKTAAIGHIITGLRPKLPSHLTPEQLGCRLGDMTLSEYLDGSHLTKLNRLKATQETHFDGTEIIDGLQCVKLRMLFRGTAPDGKTIVDKQMIWLAPDRNYLPIRSEGYDSTSMELPFVVMTASDFREIQPGIYVPFHAEKTNFYRTKDGRNVPDTKTTATVKSVDLKPNYPVEFFRRVTFAPGTLVYVQKGDNIVMSYTQPAPEPPPPSFFVRWRAALVSLAALIAVCALAIVIAYRRRMV
jgi:hypothetical protein